MSSGKKRKAIGPRNIERGRKLSDGGWIQPLDGCEFALTRSLRSYHRLVRLVYQYLPRYRCGVHYFESPWYQFPIRAMNFAHTDELYIEMRGWGLYDVDEPGDWFENNVDTDRNLIGVISGGTRKPFGDGFGYATLVVEEETTEEEEEKWDTDETALSDFHMACSEKREYRLTLTSDRVLWPLACRLTPIHHLSFRFGNATANSQLSVQCAMGGRNPYTTEEVNLHLIQAELYVRLPASTRVAAV